MFEPRAGRTRVLLLCSGLEHAHRGFESFARECFEALRGVPELDLSLVKATGEGPPGEIVARTLTREQLAARALGRAWRRESFRVEQVAFALSTIPVLARERPETVFLSEWHTALVLAAWRRAARRRFRLVLCNGTMATEGFDHLDRVQQLTPVALQEALDRGDEPRRHVLLPLGFHIDPDIALPEGEERLSLRRRLGLPLDRPIVISVAAFNRHHKRIDALIEEMAGLPAPRPFLLLVGQPERETPELRRLVEQRLGADGHAFRTVVHAEVAALLRASDLFVLASLGEGLPRALIEAHATGLRCVAHDYPVARFALGEHGRLADLRRPGALGARIGQVLAEPDDAMAEAQRRRDAFDRFGWQRLSPRYVELLTGAPVGDWTLAADLHSAGS